MIYLDDLDFLEMEKFAEKHGLQKYRAGQIFSFIHKNKAKSLDEITVLKKDLREKLKNECTLTEVKIIHEAVSKIDDTIKYLLELPDGEIVEAVYMAYEDRKSICISSQVGCNMGCVFCASTKGGKARNLTAAEMLRQIYEIENENGRIENIVIMGQGEPLDNFENLVKFLKIISDERGADKSLRKITVSTCGIPEKIKALSLHRTTDEERSKLMPINRAYNIESVIDALSYYYEKTNRRISFEYMVIGGENDSPGDAKRIRELARRIHAHVNILELNPIKEYSDGGKKNAAREFCDLLMSNGVNATFRNSRGKDIDGACGQLRRKYKERNC